MNGEAVEQDKETRSNSVVCIESERRENACDYLCVPEVCTNVVGLLAKL